RENADRQALHSFPTRRSSDLKVRDKHDVIIMQEKLDGSNVAVARVSGQLVALGRAGYPAISSKYEQHRLFAAWVFERLEQFEFLDRKSTRLNSSHLGISYAVF